VGNSLRSRGPGRNETVEVKTTLNCISPREKLPGCSLWVEMGIGRRGEGRGKEIVHIIHGFLLSEREKKTEKRTEGGFHIS